MHSSVAANAGGFSRLGIKKHVGAISALVLSLILSACGGGGGSDGPSLTAVDGDPTLGSVSIASGDQTTVTVGDIVTVSLTASEAIQAPSVTIAGAAATAVTGSGESWSAERAMTANDTVGDITFSVSFSDIAGNAGTAVNATTDGTALTFEISAEAGNVVDGPFQNAKVFADYNGNGIHDEGEPSALTDEAGAYSLTKDNTTPESYTIVVEMTADTIDSISGESYAGTGIVLKAASGGLVVTPMTTMLEAAQAVDPTYTAADLAVDMALPLGVEIATYNPFAADADPAIAHEVEKVFQQVMTATLIVAEAMAGLGDIAGVQLTPEEASAAALKAVASMVLASEIEVNLADPTQAADLQNAAKVELAANGVDVPDAIADFVLGQASGTVTQVAAAYDRLTVEDFGTSAASAISLLKHDATAELAAMSEAAATFLADDANSDLAAFDPTAFVTLNTESGVSAAAAENQNDVNDYLGTSVLVVYDDGIVDSAWGGNDTLHFFDEANDYQDCTDEAAGTESCGSVDWAVVADDARGDVLQVTYASDAQHAGLVLAKLEGSSVDLSDYATGTLSFDIKVTAMGGTTGFQLKLDSGSSNSGEIAVSDITGSGEWEAIHFPISTLAAGGLNIAAVNVPLVFFPDIRTGGGLVYQLDNVRFVAGEDNGGGDTGGDSSTVVSFTAALPVGTTTARLHSEAFGWDLNHPDGVASDNGDGTWTATIPAPWGANTNYKWVVDGAEENLLDDSQAGYCLAEDNINSGDWGANRLYSGSGDVTGQVFGECSGAPGSGDSGGGDAGGNNGGGDQTSGGFTLDFESGTADDYPSYGGVDVRMDAGVIDNDVTRNMLKIINPAGGEWWNGFTLVSEYPGSDLIGDGTDPITMRVFSEQEGDFNFELEADGVTPFAVNQTIPAGWSDVSFDVSGADASINWHKVQIRPDLAGGQVVNVADTVYKIDDVVFANATIVQAPSDPTSAEFLAGPSAPTVDASGVKSLFSDVYTTSMLNGLDKTVWSRGGDVTEIAIGNNNTVKKFDQSLFTGFDLPNDFSTTGFDTVSISLYRTAESEFEIKFVDLGGSGEGVYYVQTVEMPVNEWSTIDIPFAAFSGQPTNIDQVVVKPMGGTETFYMDDFYFHGGATGEDTSSLVTDGTFDETTSTTWSGNAYHPVDGVNKADVGAAGNPYDVNLSGTVDLTAGADYTLSFDVSGADRTIIAGIGQSAAPYLNHTDTVTLSATTQTIVMHLTAKGGGTGDNFGDATSRVIFDMGADTGAVDIDNVSLTAGHTGTVNLGSAATGGDTSNLVTDGTFDEATSTTWSGNAYHPVDGVNKADVGAAGNPYDVNLSGTVDLTAGADYTLSFDVSGADRTIIAGIGQSAAPYLNHTDTVTLSATTQTIVMHLTAKGGGTGDNFGDATSRVIFDMGADTGAVDIDNVSLTAGHTGTVNLGSAATGEDTSNLVTDGTFDEATSTTWSGNAYNPVDGVNKADVGAAGDPWNVNLSGTVNLTAGADYTLSFDVSGADRTIIAGIGQSAAPYLNHTDTVTLSATTQTIVMHLTAKGGGTGDNFGDATSRVIFDMGADTGAVDIDNVSLTAGHTGTVNLGSPAP